MNTNWTNVLAQKPEPQVHDRLALPGGFSGAIMRDPGDKTTWYTASITFSVFFEGTPEETKAKFLELVIPRLEAGLLQAALAAAKTEEEVDEPADQ